MEASVNFGAADRNFALKSAILIYQDGDQHAATVHEVYLPHGRPSLKPGQPVTVAALEQLMRNLGKQDGAAYIPEQVVSLGLNRLAWWCPAGRRRIWFKPSHDKAEAKVLKQLNGKFVWHPPLLFVAGAKGGDGLSAFALLANQRPTAETELCKAPYWNLYEDGSMCRGNIKLPIASTESLAAFERAFFNSAFSHSSGGRLTLRPGGHHGLWQESAGLAARSRKWQPDEKYWRKHLVPLKKSIGTLFK